MYTLLHGLKMPKLATAFACFALIASFGIGNMVQANSVVDGMGFIFPAVKEAGWLVGLIMAVLVGMVILGGVKRIAKVASTLVPFMAIFYVVGSLLVLANHLSDIPTAFFTIINNALNPWAVGGFDAITCHAPASASDLGAMTRIEPAPVSTAWPSCSHVYSMGYPVARTRSATASPTSTLAPSGCR